MSEFKYENHVIELMKMYLDYSADEFNTEQELQYQEMIEDWSAGEGHDYYRFRLNNDICECTSTTLFSEGCQCGVGYFQRKMNVIKQFVEDYTVMHQTMPDPDLRSAIISMSDGITEEMDPYIKLALSNEDKLISLYWGKRNPHKTRE